jgi:hypothetical protein
MDNAILSLLVVLSLALTLCFFGMRKLRKQHEIASMHGASTPKGERIEDTVPAGDLTSDTWLRVDTETGMFIPI